MHPHLQHILNWLVLNALGYIAIEYINIHVQNLICDNVRTLKRHDATLLGLN